MPHDSTHLHPWTIEPGRAIQLQEHLRQKLVLTWDGRQVNTIAGVYSIDIGDASRATIVILGYPQLTLIEAVTAQVPTSFPYISGLLAFHVGPAILAAWEKLTIKPDILMLHGHGIAHPRRFGLASHMGLWFDTPTIGIAKSRLYGNHEPVGTEEGSWTNLVDELEPKHVIGAILRTRANTRPVYVSPGHLIDLHTSIKLVFSCSCGFRLPEPLRAAHQAAANIK